MVLTTENFRKSTFRWKVFADINQFQKYYLFWNFVLLSTSSMN